MLIAAIIAAVLTLLGAAVLLGSSDERRRVRGLELSTTGSVPDGEVKLQGKAFAREPLIAPLSGQSCVVYRLIFSKWVGLGRNRRLEEVRRALQVAPGFALVDAQGSLLVDAEGAELRCEKVHTAKTSLLGTDAKVAAAIAEHAADLAGEDVRVVEEVIPEGETVLAIGKIDHAQTPLRLTGPRLLLSRLSEQALTRWDTGDFAGIGLLACGVATAVAVVLSLIGSP